VRIWTWSIFSTERFWMRGLPTPKMMIEIPVGDSADKRWVYDLFCTLCPQMEKYNLPTNEVGDMEITLVAARSRA